MGVRAVAAATLALLEGDVDWPVAAAAAAAAAAADEDHQADLQALVHQLRDVPDVVAMSAASAVDPEDPAQAARTAVDQVPSGT